MSLKSCYRSQSGSSSRRYEPRHQLAISTGSAYSSGVEAPSHVLQALGLADDLVEGALRIGLGKFTTDDEIDQAAAILSLAVHQIRDLLS